MQYLYNALRDVASLLKAADDVLGKLAQGHQDWGLTEWEVAGPLHEAALAKAAAAMEKWEAADVGGSSEESDEYSPF